MKAIGIFLCIAMAVLIGACHAKEPKVGGPHFYSSFKTKSLPEQPIGELTEAEAKQSGRSSYYVAYFNSKGVVERFTKYLGGNVDWESVYEYSPTGTVRRGLTTSPTTNGIVKIEYIFDDKGELVKQVKSVEKKTQ